MDGYYACGNSVAEITQQFSDCDVCKDLDVTITDGGMLSDTKHFEDVIQCGGSSDKNGCCSNGCWLENEQGGCGYGHCLWTVVSECSYKKCVSCGDDYVELKAVTKEQQYADMCNECGDCVCSNFLNPRERSYPCPANEECPGCASGEPPTNPPPAGTGGGVD